MKKQLLLLTALFITTIGYSQTFTAANFINYEVTSNTLPYTVKVIGYDGLNGGVAVDIPTNVDYNSISYEVTAIGDTAFFNSGITSVTIGSNVISIGMTAFLSTDLTSVIIPDSVLTIGLAAFATNNNLATVVLGSNVTSIGAAAFRYANLTSITIPASVTSIGNYAFSETSLTDIYVLGAVPSTITTGIEDTFNVDRSAIHLHIPGGTMAAYVSDAGALWTGFNPVTEDALSISDFELANDVKVITTTDAIKIIASNSIRLENYSVYSITGVKITTGNKTEIPTSFLARGIYVLKLDFDAGTVVKKIIIN